MIHDIFKVGIYEKELNIDNNFLKKYATTLSKNKDSKNTNSNVGGFHSKYLDQKKFKDLSNSVVEHANIFSKTLDYGKVKITNMWCNVNGHKDFNQTHNHPASKISGVYYVNTPENCGNITFYSHSWFVLSQAELSRNNNNYTSVTWWKPSKEGMLYLFPSWLLHSVEPNNNKKQKRICYSFNLR
jgi:uncharacterized protein (TIGR02466 family)